MKNIKTALSLALLAVAPTIYAQNTDTKAPAEPGFMVTLNVTNNGGGTDSLKIAKDKDDTLLDKLLFTGSKANYEILRGTEARMGLQAEKGKKIKSMTVGEITVAWDATDATSTTDGSKGTVSFKTGGTNYYSLPLGAIDKKTDIAITWEEKASWDLKYENTSATVGSAVALKVLEGNEDKTASLVQGYYKTADHTGDKVTQSIDMAAGTYYVWLKAEETADKKGLDVVVPYQVNNKLALTIKGDNPKCEDNALREGQPLSVATITGGICTYGEREIKGTWAWADPNQKLVKGAATSYTAVFTPDSSDIYNTKTENITVSALYVATVTAEQSAGGTVVIKDATPDNKYVGTTSAYANITATATPAKGYKFVSWASPVAAADNSNETENMEVAKEKTVSAAADGTVFKATFAKATRKVTIASASNGTVQVLNGATPITSGDNIPYGTNLTIVATPASGKQVKSVSYTYKAKDSGDGTTTTANNFVVGGDEGGSYTVDVVFEDIPAQKVMVTVTAPVNGSITLLDKDNKAVNPNSSVDEGSNLTIVAVPNRGYKLEWLKAGNEEVTGDFITVNTAIDIKASFVKEKYEVTNQAPEQVEFSNVTFDPSEFNTPIQNVTASIKEEYKGTHKLVSLLLNNQAIANGKNDLLVEGNMNFSALVKKLEPISIQNDKKTDVVYNGSAYVYTVKTAANLSDFKVTFKDKDGNEVVAPSTVGTYKVIIARDADDLYAAYKNETDYTLAIKPGMPGVLDIPFVDKLSAEETTATTTVAGKWMSQADFQREYPNREPATKADVSSSVIYFVPSDDNLGYVKTTSVKSTDAGDAKTITINYTGEANLYGTVSVENDFISVSKTYEGLKLTLNAKADAGYKIDWNKISVTGGSTPNSSDHTFTVSDHVTVSVAAGAFSELSAPNTPTDKKVELTYTGNSLACSPSILGLATDVVWKIQYVKQSNNADTYTTTDPIDAGTYKIKVSCDNSAEYRALTGKEIGTLTINPQELTASNIQVPNASPVAKNAMLSTSILDTNGKVINAQGNPVPGEFTWAKDALVEEAGNQKVLFTPNDANNYSVNYPQLSSYVSLKGVATYVMTVKAENGSASNLIFTDATGKVINPTTDKVPAGMKLFITTTSGTIEDVSVVGANAGAGSESISGEPKKWYCIAGSEAFTVTVTFKSGSEGGGDTPEEGVAVTGISLNKTTLTLPRLKSEKLVATVTPTGATKKDVKWTSTNPEVATVDADGTVKAVKYGQATIIATTVDGGFTAMCQVNVDFATAIEKILSESLVYSRNGQIIIEPAAPVEISIINLGGQVIYNNSISGTVQVPANNGVYIVRMAAAGKATTTKVIVR